MSGLGHFRVCDGSKGKAALFRICGPSWLLQHAATIGGGSATADKRRNCIRPRERFRVQVQGSGFRVQGLGGPLLLGENLFMDPGLGTVSSVGASFRSTVILGIGNWSMYPSSSEPATCEWL